MPTEPGEHEAQLRIQWELGNGKRGETTASLRGSAVPLSRMNDSYTQTPDPRLDLVLVVDHHADLRRLFANVERLIRGLQSAPFHFRAGVLSADVSSSAGALVREGVEPELIDSRAPNFARVLAHRIGLAARVNGTATPLDAVRRHAERSRRGAGARGMKRDRLLGVLVLSERRDESPGAVTDYLQALATAEGYRDLETSVIGPFDPLTCGVQVDDGRLEAFALGTYGFTRNSCATDWPLDGLSHWQSFQYPRSTFYLTATPRLPLEVRRNGRPVAPDAWQYDPIQNAVSFVENAIPRPSEHIVISYDLDCPSP